MNKNIPTVLVIDDNPENIKVVGNIIKRNNINVLVSLNGATGIEMAKVKNPDIILLDIQMPQMDGFEVCRILKSDALTADIPIIFLTARNDDETIEKVFSIGAADYTQKPFSETELVARIKFHIKLSYTEKKMREALEEAKKANQAKSDFLSNVSHEIRTPLNSIIGYSEILAEEEENIEKAKKLNTIITSGKHLLSVINDILDFSKIESGKIETVESKVSIRSLIKKVQDMFIVLKEKKGLSFLVFISHDVPEEVITDEQKVEQILINLINNAFKFTEKGVVKVECTYENGEIVFIVSDTGIGIKEENKSKIFSAFEQTGSDIAVKYGGTGLGLSISKRFAQLMNGDLTFVSEYGKGSEFTLRIKAKRIEHEIKNESMSIVEKWIASDVEIEDLIIKAIYNLPETVNELKLSIDSSNVERINFSIHKIKGFFGNFHMNELYLVAEKMYVESQKAEPNIDTIKKYFLEIENIIKLIPEQYMKKKLLSNENISDKCNSINVIVADDVEDNRNLIELILKKIGVNIDFAVNGKELLEKLEIKKYDLVLLDVQMPEMDGKEAIVKIRENEKYSDLEVFALTAQAGNTDREYMLNAGCNGYITKPIDKNILRNTVKAFIEKRGMEK